MNPKSKIISLEFLVVLAVFPQLYGTLFPFKINQIVYFLLTITIIYKILNDNYVKLASYSTIGLVAFGMFVLYVNLSSWWSPSEVYAFSKQVQLLSIITLLLLAGYFVGLQIKRLERLIQILLIVSLLIALVAVLTGLIFGVRAHVLLPPASHLGIGRVIGVGFPIIIYYYASGRIGLYYGILLLSLVISSLIFAISRMALIAGFGAMFIYIIYILHAKSSFRSNVTNLVSVLVLKITIVLAIIISAIDTRFYSHFTLSQLSSSGEGRLNLWIQSIEFWLERPLFGHGIGSTPILWNGIDSRAYPHNIFIEALSELGIVGATLYLILIFYPFIQCIRANKRSIFLGLLVSLFIYSILISSVSFDIVSNRLLYLFVGIFYGYSVK